MTEGSPLTQIVMFSIPLLLGNLFQQLYNMVDAAIVGRILGAKALGAVGASSSVLFLILGFCIGICAGFAVPISHKFGANDMEALRKYVYQSFVLSVVIGAALTILCVVFCDSIIHLLKTPDDIYTDAYIYLLIIFIGIPFTVLYNLTAGIMRAVGNSKMPFIFLAISSVLNIGLDLLLIVTFQMGVAGAAIATIASQGVSGIACLIYMLTKMRILIPLKNERKFNLSYSVILLRMGVPMGLQFSITAIGAMMMQTATNALGSVYVSAFAASLKLKQLMMCPFDAIGTSVATFVGQNFGAGKYKRIQEGLVKGTGIAVLYGIIAGIILSVFGREMSLMFIDPSEVEVINYSYEYQKCLGYFFWSLGFLNVLRLTIQGLGYTNRAIISGVIEMVARTAMSLFVVPVYGFLAICYTDQSAWITAAIYVIIMSVIVMRKIKKKLPE